MHAESHSGSLAESVSQTMERGYRFLGERVEFSLSYAVLAGAAVGAIVALVIAFMLGQMLASRAVSDSASSSSKSALLNLPRNIPSATPPPGRETASRVPERDAKKDAGASRDAALAPKTGDRTVSELAPGAADRSKSDKTEKPEKDDRAVASEPQPGAGAPTFRLEKGKHYIQVQCFEKRREADATRAAKFLRENGVPVAIEKRRDDFALYVAEPFAIKDQPAAQKKQEQDRAQELTKRIKQLGRDYGKMKDGGYDFKFAALIEIE